MKSVLTLARETGSICRSLENGSPKLTKIFDKGNKISHHLRSSPGGSLEFSELRLSV